MPDLASARAHNHARLNRIAAVENGALESNAELLSGFPFSRGSAELSAQAWIDETIQDLEQGFFEVEKLVAALQALRRRFDADRLQKVIKIAEAGAQPEIAQRALIYLACVPGQVSVRARVAAMSLSCIVPSDLSAPFYLATALGLALARRASSMSEFRTAGFQDLDKIVGTMSMLRDASKCEPEPTAPDDEFGVDDDFDDEFMQALLEDRAEIVKSRPKTQTVVVVPSYPAPPAGKTDRGSVKRDLHSIAGKRLRLVETGDVAAHMIALRDRAPHLVDIFDGMLRDTAMSPHVRIRPWLLVGEPGSGKSWAAREFAEVLGLPSMVFDAGSSSDGTFGGTSAQWSSAGVSKPLQLVHSSRAANPLVIIDEVEKAGNSPANGSLHSSLLSFLDPGSAAQIHDPALELRVDLSHVNYVLTANDLSMVPAPLRDRCRVVRVPDPKPEHVGVLVKRIVEDIARKQDLDPRWLPPLEPDEMENVRKAWGGGSIRRLRHAVQSALDFRAQHVGRC
jgi:hypothetical protein